MRLLDVIRSRSRDRREVEELLSLRQRLCERGGENESVSRRTAIPSLAAALLDSEGVFSASEWAISENLSPAETVRLTQLFSHLLALREGNRVEEALDQLIEPLAVNVPPAPEGDEDFGLAVCLLEVMHEPRRVIDALVRVGLTSPFPRLKSTLEHNLMLVSGIDPGEPTRKRLILPIDAKEEDPFALVEIYFQGTPFVDFLRTPRPFKFPLATRFEHTHIVGGSGHGKTQLLQHLILHDLEAQRLGRGSIIVIDSQGDMIRTITHLAEFRQSAQESLADRLILIDPNDIENPTCLNLFDFGLDRLGGYSPIEREKLLNGAIALYEYMFGALLGAELTQRQGVIFRYLGRLLTTVPGATIHTLLRFMENPEEVMPYVASLEGSARHFFETQFASKAFIDIRQQILNRLWGILSNAVLERMFYNERNKVIEAMNSGKIILINTARLIEKTGWLRDPWPLLYCHHNPGRTGARGHASRQTPGNLPLYR